MTKKEAKTELEKGLAEKGYEALGAKGGFFVRGLGFKTQAWARKVTGIAAPKRVKRERVRAWGDYATIAALNGGFGKGGRR